ncbi:MAG: type II secretion system F family protein [Nanoarchaeota archaeon]
MKIQKPQIIGFVLSLIVGIISIFFFGTKFFFLFIGIAILVGIFPFVFGVMRESKIETQKEEMFLEFSRNLVESVKAGTPISKSILNTKNKYYGVLTKHVTKLSNQIRMGIPLRTALQIFADDVNNKTISRAITLIGQAEKSGGDIGEILEAVAGAVNMSDKLKKEQKASISNLISQGYIIFFVFIIIILIMQFKILPMLSGISGVGGKGVEGLGAFGVGGGEPINQEELSTSFLYLLLVQGFFSGLTIGKLAEGDIKAGVKHSFALMLFSFLISAIANVFFIPTAT